MGLAVYLVSGRPIERGTRRVLTSIILRKHELNKRLWVPAGLIVRTDKKVLELRKSLEFTIRGVRLTPVRTSGSIRNKRIIYHH